MEESAPLADDSQPCRLCGTHAALFYKDARSFYRCPLCHFIFTNQMADSAAQEAHYKGQWGNQDEAYLKNQADNIVAVLSRYGAPLRILDFGSGSGSLARQLAGRGYGVTELEPMIHGYLKDQHYPAKFDAIVAVEVIEHLPNMWEELEQLDKVLADGGVMLFATLLTNRFIDADDAREQFAAWWYKDDQTHVNFFCNRALAIMGRISGWTIDIYANQLFVVRKGA
ncbi:MAG: class I SAM-dependent methyltransferase [Nitrospinae bacterium]|nr:class I SAM-dependent methyltransferase [Nitrospinota bacterium]